MKIDAHQHFWRLSRSDYGWLTPDFAPIYRDFGPADLTPILHRHRIARTILVQAAPTEDETHFLLDIAAKHDFVAGVVGWTDFEMPGVSKRIEVLAANALLVGLRPMLHDLPDDCWILRPAVEPALHAMAANNLVFDALVRPRHLPVIAALAARHPHLRIVIDHAGKPDIAHGSLRPWSEDLARLATFPNVFVKLSGLLTEAASKCRAEDLAPYFDNVLKPFGARRVLWGSDWPVLTLAATYDDWHALTENLLQQCPGSERAAIFGNTAAQLYLSSRGRKK